MWCLGAECRIGTVGVCAPISEWGLRASINKHTAVLSAVSASTPMFEVTFVGVVWGFCECRSVMVD